MIGSYAKDSDFRGFFEAKDLENIRINALRGRFLLENAGIFLWFDTSFNEGRPGPASFTLEKKFDVVTSGHLYLCNRVIEEIEETGRYSGLNNGFAHINLGDARRLNAEDQRIYDLLKLLEE